MKPYYFLLLQAILVISLSCQKEPTPPSPTQVVKDEVIVWQEPLWSVPHDTANYLSVIIYPYWQFDDKVIVDTYKDGKGGFRCMIVETGEVVWEKYFNTSADYTGEQRFILRGSLFTPEEGYLIIMIGGWGERRHIKLDIETGETLWETPLETLGVAMDVSGNHYYCLVNTSDDVCPIYRVDISSGAAEYFYSTPLPAHPNIDWQRLGYARPFHCYGKEYIFIAETRRSKSDSVEYFASLLDTETMELLVKHIPLDNHLNKVEVFNNQVYLFTGGGYKIFSMETLTFERDVRLIDWGDYIYHTFYKDKLIVGLSPNNTLNVNGHYVVDLKTHKLLHIFEGWILPPAILDDVLYFVSAGQIFQAYNLNTGQRVLNFDLRYSTQFGVATYKNAKGKKFVVVGDAGFTYCYEAI
ncbi:MAG: hypothetical protein RBR40_15100 [Tenuifilaceae bacterium]|nr:hypothetical protein [Tenuifilaceae bacterium]